MSLIFDHMYGHMTLRGRLGLFMVLYSASKGRWSVPVEALMALSLVNNSKTQAPSVPLTIMLSIRNDAASAHQADTAFISSPQTPDTTMIPTMREHLQIMQPPNRESLVIVNTTI